MSFMGMKKGFLLPAGEQPAPKKFKVDIAEAYYHVPMQQPEKEKWRAVQIPPATMVYPNGMQVSWPSPCYFEKIPDAEGSV